MIKVEPVQAFSDNYIWLIIQTDNQRVAIVDPGDAAPVLQRLQNEQLEPAAILITHHHPDHTGGVRDLLDHYTIPVYGPGTEQIPCRSHALGEGDVVDLQNLSMQFRVMDIPGHTAGAIAYYGNDMVFVGDTLFMSGCGRLFEGTPAQMHQSLSRLATLPDSTLVYCGHEYTLANLKFAQAVEPGNQDIQQRMEQSQVRRKNDLPTVPGSIALEKLTNPFLRTGEPNVIAAANRHRQQKSANATEVFATLRSWKDKF
ncbi:MAG: Hydroxyacylglutathione hydrolase [Gammaproteobacteria bacterium]|nr:Hydroxyacylglutathione hydrolase [Gammaproteobacteria bacterium]